jgi:hypothetical protein
VGSRCFAQGMLTVFFDGIIFVTRQTPSLRPARAIEAVVLERGMSRHLTDVQALVLDPLAAVAVGVLESEVVIWAELLREDVVCKEFCQFMRLVRLAITIQSYRPRPKPGGCSSGRP